MGLVQKAKELCEKALPLVGAENEIGQAVMTFLQKVGKILSDGAVTPGVAENAMMQFMAQQRQDGPQNMILQALARGQAGGAPPGAPPPGAVPPPPPAG